MWRFFLIWLVLASSVGYAVYHLKYEVARKERVLTQLNRQILVDQEAIQVLKAEWSFLNQPQRIEEVARTHLGLEPLTVKQITRVASLPMKAQPLPTPNGPRRPAPDVPQTEPDPLFEEGASGLPDDLDTEGAPAAPVQAGPLASQTAPGALPPTVVRGPAHAPPPRKIQ